MKNHIKLAGSVILIAMLAFTFSALSLTGCSSPTGPGGGGGEGGGGDGDGGDVVINISEFEVMNLKTEFAQNDTFTLGEPPTGAVDVYISFSNGTELTQTGITKAALEALGFTVSGYDMDTLGTQTVTIKYKDFALEYTYDIEIVSPETPIISISTQPQNAVFKVGAITGNLSILATVSPSGSPDYQWYSNTVNNSTSGTIMTGKTGTSLAIPTDLTAGSHYYYCVVSATGAADKASNVAMVTVVPFSGAGTSGDPYLIYNITDLSAMRDLVNASTAPYVTAYYQLEASFPASDWTPIGSTSGRSFQGNFNGNKQTITLTVNRSGQNYNGLFGYVTGTVRNLGVEATVNGNQYNGGIAGYVAAGGSISNCYVSGTVSGTGNWTGGVAGYVVGLNSKVTNCYSSATVSGTSNVGGIVGYLYTNAQITYCYATGAISGTDCLGGVAGQDSSTMARITCCVALNPSVTSTTTNINVGRISGSSTGTLTNNAAFVGITVNGALVTNGTLTNKNGADINSAAAKTEGTYSGRSWAFGTTEASPWKWGIGAYTLPVLYWQSAPAPTYPAHIAIGISPADPILITNRANFLTIGNAGTAAMHYKQTADITLTPGDLISIPLDGSFTGSYDGNGWEIKSYQIKGRTDTANGVGLFPKIGSGGVVKNLRLTGVTSNTKNTNWDVGALAGINNGRIENCSVTGTSVQGGYNVGGIVGRNDGGVVQNCWTNIAVEATYSPASGATIVGGIAGINGSAYQGKIENCYALGAVTGYNSVGGIAGYLGNGVESIKGCVALNASIHATSTGTANLIGRIAGDAPYNGITACFYRTGLTPTGDGWTAVVTGSSSKNGGEVLANTTTTGYYNQTWWANTAVSIGPGFKFGSTEANPWKPFAAATGALPKLWFE